MLGYKTSQDYEQLWELVMQGYRVPGWVHWPKMHFSIVECKMAMSEEPLAVIGSRGIAYADYESKESFLLSCQSLELQYIEPTEKI